MFPERRPATFLAPLLSGLLFGACATPMTTDPMGGGGSGGGGPMPVMKDPSNYPQNTAGAAFPYPQGHASPYCTLAIYNTDVVATAYMNWKSRFFDGSRVVRPENSNDTVSEGIGYGMLIGVYMNDKSMFDAIWSYAKSHFDGNGLMNWNINSGGGTAGSGSATDGDEDMAWALIMAGKQWNSATYTNDASTLIRNLKAHALDGNTLKPGDNFGGASQTNPSYFAPSYYRAFARVTGDSGWMSVLDQSYSILAASSGSNGLVPNWVNSSGAGIAGPGGDSNGPYFGYDACRTPWRIAMDYCETGEPRAKAYLDKIVAFYAAQAPTAINMLKDGYTGAGANPSGTLGDYSAGMAFYGPGGTAAMEGGAQPDFVRRAWAGLVNQTTGGAMTASGVFTYFNASWGVLSMLAMSGNFWDMAP
jgi:endo-1,4-beta-D-glucanase Y